MFSKRYKFSEWSSSGIPQVAAGVYAIWQGEELVYCGMSGRQIEKNRYKAKFGLITRIQSHASGELKLEGLTKSYIHEHLEYQYLVVESSEEAYDIENKARAGETFGKLPLLNPIT